MVEARGELFITCPQENEPEYDMSRLPASVVETDNPLVQTYYVGKQTLKKMYFSGIGE